MKFGFEFPPDQEALSSASENVTGVATGLSPTKHMAPEMGGVTQLDNDIETGRGVKSPVDPVHMESKKRQESFHSCSAKITARGNKFLLGLNLHEEDTSDERLGCNVNNVVEGFTSSTPRKPAVSVVEGAASANILLKPTREDPSLSPQQKSVKDCIREFEGKSSLVPRGTIVPSKQLQGRSKGQNVKNESCDVALETAGGRRSTCSQMAIGTALTGNVETSEPTAVTPGPDQQPSNTFAGAALGTAPIAAKGTQLNADLEAPEIPSRVKGKTVRAFIGALEALSRESSLKLNTSQRRVSRRASYYGSPIESPRENMRNCSFHLDVASEAIEAISRERALNSNSSPRMISHDSPKECSHSQERSLSLHVDSNTNDGKVVKTEFSASESAGPDITLKECAQLSNSLDIPLSCSVKVNRQNPQVNANAEAAKGSKLLHKNDNLSEGKQILDLDISSASRQSSDTKSLEFISMGLTSEAPERNVAYIGLGVDTGARGVTRLTLGIATAGGVMEILIPRNTPIPTKMEVLLSTYVDYQTEVRIQIFEGERFQTMDNKLLGTFDLSGIAPMPRGVAQISVSFEIDVEGIMNVFVKDKSTGTRKLVTITSGVGCLSEEVVERMIQDGKKNKLNDEIHKSKIGAKRILEAYTYQLRDLLSDEEVCKYLDPKDKEKMDGAVENVINWLLYSSWLLHCYNQLGEAADFEQKLAELKTICNPILENIYRQATTAHYN